MHMATDIHQPNVAITIPIMAERLDYNIDTYCQWRANGFELSLVAAQEQYNQVVKILENKCLHPGKTFTVHYYTPGPCTQPNAGIAKNEAYTVLLEYINNSQFNYAILLDDTVNEIINTKTGVSLMTTPEEFCKAVRAFAEESSVFGGTVAPKRHPRQCGREGVVPVKGAFLQQAIFFSCRGTPTLRKHFVNTDEYVSKMRLRRYPSVPFGEDVLFQLSLYEEGVIPDKKSAQFWGIGVSRIRHKSATKRKFHEMEDTTKEEMKAMIIYLRDQGALVTNSKTNELTGIRVIPGGRKRIRISGVKGERPWREVYNFAFASKPIQE